MCIAINHKDPWVGLDVGAVSASSMLSCPIPSNVSRRAHVDLKITKSQFYEDKYFTPFYIRLCDHTINILFHLFFTIFCKPFIFEDIFSFQLFGYKCLLLFIYYMQWFHTLCLTLKNNALCALNHIQMHMFFWCS